MSAGTCQHTRNAEGTTSDIQTLFGAAKLLAETADGVTSESLGDYSYSYGPGSFSVSALGNNSMRTLENWRRVFV